MTTFPARPRAPIVMPVRGRAVIKGGVQRRSLEMRVLPGAAIASAASEAAEASAQESAASAAAALVSENNAAASAAAALVSENNAASSEADAEAAQAASEAAQAAAELAASNAGTSETNAAASAAAALVSEGNAATSETNAAASASAAQTAETNAETAESNAAGHAGAASDSADAAAISETNAANSALAAQAAADSVRWEERGAYSGVTAYVENDLVLDQGSTWVALQATTGNAPPTLPTSSNAYWQLVARVGNDGEDGEDGAPGLIQSITAGDNISVDATDPANPIISATGGGEVESVNDQTGIVVLDADDIDDTATTHKFVNAAEKALIASAVQPSDLGDLAALDTVGSSQLDAAAVTNSKLANMAQSTFKGRVTASTGVPEDLTAAQAATIVSAGKPAFSAHKNGTNQTGIASATGTKVTFSTELFDVGGYFDTTQSRFTPPAGKYILVGNLLPTAGVVDQQVGWALIYKNGSQIYSTRNGQSGTAAQTTAITVCVDANGTDYFELYYRGDGAGDKTLFGGETETYFIGWQL